MKKWLRFIFCCMVFCFLWSGDFQKGWTGDHGFSNVSTVLPVQNPGRKWLKDTDFGNIPLYFIPNQGQVKGNALFYTKTTKYTLWFNEEGLVFQAGPDVSRLVFPGAVKNPELVPEIPTQHKVHYFKGGENPRSYRNIPTSRAVRFKSLYNHIDLKVYGVEKQIEYDWVVKPGGNPGEIRFQYQGVKEISRAENGDLAIQTGSYRWTHKKPVAYQVINGRKVPVEVDFATIKQNENTYGFKVGSYHKDYELIIDPIVISFSTPMGGNGEEEIYGLAVNNAGEIYVTGYTQSSDFPVLNPYQATLQGSQDAFVTKFTPDGTALVFSTFLGGNDYETGYSIKLDDSGNVYVGGVTSSSTFPIVNPVQGTLQGVEDGFITKLSPDGSTLAYSTYLGGSEYDQVAGIDVNGSGELVAVGYTDSLNFPVQGALQPAIQGYTDIFVVKLSPSGSLLFSTYLGGSGFEGEFYDHQGPGAAMDSTGAVYVTGTTTSVDFPLVNAVQPVYGGGDQDGFITKISADGTALVYSTYLGGGSSDSLTSIDTDNSGGAYLTGCTYSSDFPTTPNSFMPGKPNPGGLVTIIAKISAGGSSLDYSTYFGGPWEDGFTVAHAITVGASGSAYITGETDTSIPLVDPLDIGGPSEYYPVAFLAKLSPDGSQLNFSSYIGEDDYSGWGNAVAVDSSEKRIFMGGIIGHYGYYMGYIVKLLDTDYAELTVTYPNGGEELAVSSVRDITWTSSGTVPWVKIQYTPYLMEYGTEWITIAESVPNTGSYSWTVPNTLPPGCPCCFVRIMGPEGYPLDQSDEGFTIRDNTEAFISLDKPNGNEVWYIGVPYEILWSSGDPVEYVSIEYTTDNGDTWTPIATSIINTGSYNWTIPDTPSTQCRVRVWDPTNIDLTDTSSGMFTIAPITDARIPLSEREALIALHLSTSQYEWSWCYETNWHKSGDPNQFNDHGTECTWYGVTCNPEHTHVIGIDLSDNCVYGTLPPELADLTEVKTLDLRGQIVGPLPDLGGLMKLETLRLDGYGFEGNIPTWINNLVSLKDLELDYCGFSGDIPPINNLIHLETLYLSHNFLTGPLPPLNTLTNLKWVNLSNNNLSGSFPDLSSLTQLRTFEAYENQFTGSIPNFSAATQLTVLGLSLNHISGNIPSWIGGLINLQTLDLSYNQLSGPIPPELGSLTALQFLSLIGNGSAGEIPGTLANLTNLQNSTGLNIRYNGLYTGNSSLRDFLQSKSDPGYPWEDSQTIAPTGLTASEETLDSIKISWTPIIYQGNTGGYRVYYSTTSGGEYTLAGTTADKGVNNYTVTGLEADTTYYFAIKTYTDPHSNNQNTVISEYSTEISAATLEEASIAITAPNGGESWEATSSHPITWTSTGSIANVKIEYSTNNGSSWNTIIDSTSNTGSYNWTILNTPAATCLVKVSDTSGTASDTSDAVFTIAVLRTVTITAPNGGENWEATSSHSITWTSTGSIANVKIEYSTNNGSSWNTIIESTGNTGSYNWTIPNTPATTCLVKVSDTAGTASDTSDAVFTIAVLRTVTITAPNGGESWEATSSHPITWASTGSIANVKIEYSTNNGSSWNTIIESTGNTGSYNWTIPNTPATNCLVKVSDTSGTASDTSDAVFTIAELRTVTVTAPNGGESWEATSSHSITWTSTGSIANVKIEYSTNNGSSWNTIIESTVNTGSYNWTIPNTPAATCLVKVSDTSGTASDTSDAVFTIAVLRTVTVTAPNGGENWEATSSHLITWTSTGSIANVKIEYSTNNGSSWNTIIESTGNTGSYNWTIPNTPAATCLVKVSDTSGTASDTSDAVFTIAVLRTVTVTAPNGGESWEVTTSQTITWTSTGSIGNVKIEYSTNNGSSWNTIIESTGNTGSYNWTIPNTPATTCLVKVSDTSDTASDTSDAVFTIAVLRTVTVTAPNGSENLLANTTYAITWSNTGSIPNVKIEYSTDNGSSWNVIIASAANSGSYNWTVPNTPSINCLVKVSDLAGPASDQSNAVFKITSVTYCASSGSSQTRGYISNVQVGSLNNPSGSSGYTNFTSLNANLTAGSNASVVLTPTGGTSYTKYWKIWIDYNRDGDFTDSGENVVTRSGKGVVSGNFTVPVSTAKGTTRMRVSMRSGNNPPTCSSFNYGEVEDYTANIQ